MKKVIVVKKQVLSLTADEVMEKFTPLCHKLSRKYFIEGYEMEDLVQVCYIALFKAYTLYDKESGVDFLDYSYQLMNNELKRLLRDSKTEKRNTDNVKFVELEQRPGGSSDAYTYSELIADITVNVEEQVINSELINLIKEVVTEEEMVLLPVLMGMKTQKKVSEEIGISNEAVRKRVNKLKEKLKNVLKNN